MRQRGVEGWVATVLILSKTADAAAADAAANQTHLWWYPLGYNTNPHPTFHPDSSLTPSPSSTVTQPLVPLAFSRVLSLLLSLFPSLLFSFYPFSTLSLFESMLSSRRSCSQRALDKMPRKPRVCGTPASSARFIDIYIHERIVHSIIDRVQIREKLLILT